MSSIADTVHESLRQHGLGSYASQARPVIYDLQARESKMSESLIAYAREQGLDETDTTTVLRQVGMTVPEPGSLASAHSANSDDPNELTTVLARINGTLDSLAQFARQNGWHG